MADYSFEFYLLLSIIRWRGVKIVFGQKPLYTYQQMPLEDFYNHYMPLLLKYNNDDI